MQAMPQDDLAPVRRLYERLTEALQRTRRDPFNVPVTVAEIYRELVPYRLVRTEIGFDMNADYEHALLRLLAGEGEWVRIEPPQAAEEIRQELRSANPNSSLYRAYAGCDVWVSKPQPTVATAARPEDHAMPAAAVRGAQRPSAEPAGNPRGATARSTQKPLSTILPPPSPAPIQAPVPAPPPAAARAAVAPPVAARTQATRRDAEPSRPRQKPSVEDMPEPASDGPVPPESREADVTGEAPAAAVFETLTLTRDAGPADREGTDEERTGAVTAMSETPKRGAASAGASSPPAKETRSATTPRPAAAAPAVAATPGRGTPAAAPKAGGSAAARCAFCDSALPQQRQARFCPYCGADQTTRPCPSCGDPLEPGWAFCITCGATAR